MRPLSPQRPPNETAAPQRAKSLFPSWSPKMAGLLVPRRLGEILKLELLSGKTGAEVTAIWKDYHGAKEGTHGITVPNKAEVARAQSALHVRH